MNQDEDRKKSAEILTEFKKEYLKERLTFRQKLFLEWAFVDRRLIQDSQQFIQETREIEDEIVKLNEEELKTRKEITCICKECGICTKMERELVFLKDEPFSIIADEIRRCNTCNSYDDGSTLKIFSPLLKKIKTDTYREFQHRLEINLEYAREAGRLSTLEKIEEWINNEIKKDNKDTDEVRSGYVFALLETKEKIKELKRGTENSEYTTKAVPITNGIVNYILTGK